MPRCSRSQAAAEHRQPDQRLPVGGPSCSHDQRIPRCRGSDGAAPGSGSSPGGAARSWRRRASCAGEWVASSGAASSMASGTPSRASTTARTARSSSRTRSWRTRRPRSARRVRASSSGSGSTASRTSPATASGDRDVTSSRTPPGDPSQPTISSDSGSNTPSAPSRISRRCTGSSNARWRARSRACVPAGSTTPSADATVDQEVVLPHADQRAPPDPVDGPAVLAREAGLPDSGRANEGHQAGAGERVGDRAEQHHPTDERSELRREVGAMGRQELHPPSGYSRARAPSTRTDRRSWIGLRFLEIIRTGRCATGRVSRNGRFECGPSGWCSSSSVAPTRAR